MLVSLCAGLPTINDGALYKRKGLGLYLDSMLCFEKLLMYML